MCRSEIFSLAKYPLVALEPVSGSGFHGGLFWNDFTRHLHVRFIEISINLDQIVNIKKGFYYCRLSVDLN
jgi:hypothetical protein